MSRLPWLDLDQFRLNQPELRFTSSAEARSASTNNDLDDGLRD
jgi:hypothetical protein